MLRILVACGVLAATSPSQDVLGLLNRTDTSFTSRGSSTPPNTNPSFAFVRIDHENYAGWGIDAANPGMHSIQGLRVVLQDQIANTPETFGILVYGEDAAAPDFPDIATPLGTAGPVPTPASAATTAIVWDLRASFTTPILAPTGADVFPAVDLPQPVGNVWPNDGLSVHALYYVMVTSGTFDLPGAAHPTASQAGNGGYHVPVAMIGPTYTITPRQWKIEPIVGGAVGVAGTITNQTVSAPLSTAAPGTSSMASGLHPDARNPPLNPGRADDVASRWFRTGTPNNTPVLFLLDIGSFGIPIPVSALVPGSTGTTCLNIASAQVTGIVFTVSGEAILPITIPAGVRPFLAGIPLLHQAAAFNAAGGVDANGCTRQVF